MKKQNLFGFLKKLKSSGERLTDKKMGHICFDYPLCLKMIWSARFQAKNKQDTSGIGNILELLQNWKLTFATIFRARVT